MSAQPASAPAARYSLDMLRLARDVVLRQSEALAHVASRLDESFCTAVSLVHGCRGSIIVSGMGKAGLVGQKIAATLASMGIAAHFVHPAEAVHGDLGRIRAEDVVLVLSQSGETAETTRILPALRQIRVRLVAITCRRASTLGRASDVVIDLGPMEEADPLGLAPTTSTTAMLAVGDALAIVTSRLRGFTREHFAQYHPGGSLGRKLALVQDEMRPLAQCRVADETDTVRTVFIHARRQGRRTGAIMLVDGDGRLSGLFTDSDLARLFEDRREAAFDEPIARVMTRLPKTAPCGTRLVDAVNLMAAMKISELPVVDEAGAPIGMIDVTDIVGLLPEETFTEEIADPAATVPFPSRADM